MYCFIFRNFKLFVNEIYGDCYTFNAGWGSNFAPIKSLKAGRRHGNRLSHFSIAKLTNFVLIN